MRRQNERLNDDKKAKWVVRLLALLEWLPKIMIAVLTVGAILLPGLLLFGVFGGTSKAGALVQGCNKMCGVFSGMDIQHDQQKLNITRVSVTDLYKPDTLPTQISSAGPQIYHEGDFGLVSPCV